MPIDNEPKIMVMNRKTWENMKDDMATKAIDSVNPLEYIDSWREVDVDIDETLPDEYVEVYYKWQYELILKDRKKER